MAKLYGLKVVEHDGMPPNTVAVLSGGGGHAWTPEFSRYWRYIDGLRFEVWVVHGR